METECECLAVRRGCSGSGWPWLALAGLGARSLLQTGTRLTTLRVSRLHSTIEGDVLYHIVGMCKGGEGEAVSGSRSLSPGATPEATRATRPPLPASARSIAACPVQALVISTPPPTLNITQTPGTHIQ